MVTKQDDANKAMTAAYVLGLDKGMQTILEHMAEAIAEIQALVSAPAEPDPDDWREAKEEEQSWRQDHADEQHTRGL
jgi:ABC-type nitrate/sulfonate/bicarbonate transport system substrate-binding protein